MRERTVTYKQTKNISYSYFNFPYALLLFRVLLTKYWLRALISSSGGDEFIEYATNDKEEIQKVLSVGFEYICQKDDMLFFRKRK